MNLRTTINECAAHSTARDVTGRCDSTLVRCDKASVLAGNSTERLDNCENLALPASFTQYLNTSFLGERQFIEAGPVNYSFYQFGPLNTQAAGVPNHAHAVCKASRSCLPQAAAVSAALTTRCYTHMHACTTTQADQTSVVHEMVPTKRSS